MINKEDFYEISYGDTYPWNGTFTHTYTLKNVEVMIKYESTNKPLNKIYPNAKKFANEHIKKCLKNNFEKYKEDNIKRYLPDDLPNKGYPIYTTAFYWATGDILPELKQKCSKLEAFDENGNKVNLSKLILTDKTRIIYPPNKHYWENKAKWVNKIFKKGIKDDK